ncbi:30S ribosomal protein S5 [Zea mays]|uniref:30S ribosomal protein S5 n=1 Tax=Zea mays TaxID=4577 RepID=A0A3L6EIT4_MAIZE|nr:30S ribosomal protein S5 [Zea mays]
MAAAVARSRAAAAWARLLSLRPHSLASSTALPRHGHHLGSRITPPRRHLAFSASSGDARPHLFQSERVVHELLAEVERERQRERQDRRAKDGKDQEEEPEEDEEDYMGVKPLIEKLERRKTKEMAAAEGFWEPTDSDSDEDDERYTPDAIKQRVDEFERKCKRHEEFLQSFAEADTLDEAHKWMTKINNFEERHLKLPLEYRVIGDMMNRLKDATGKERFVLLQKLNRAVRIMEIKEAYDPSNPANFGTIQHQQVGSPEDVVLNAGFDKEKQMIQGAELEDDDEEFNDVKERDDILIDKLDAIEKKIEGKLELLDHTFGKKGRALEEEIKDLVEERNSLSEKSRRPMYRKGFDVKVIDVNRTCKVTKGGQIAKFTALLATGNYNGVVGFAKAKGPTAKIAIQRAYEKCFQNLHYMERYEDHTIAHAIQAKYEKTKVNTWKYRISLIFVNPAVVTLVDLIVYLKIYLWPGPMRSGMSAAGRTVETVLYLAGFSNVKTKIIGSRNPLNVIKALFIALNAIETPKDVQQKFGRTVVESYLL